MSSESLKNLITERDEKNDLIFGIIDDFLDHLQDLKKFDKNKQEYVKSEIMRDSIEIYYQWPGNNYNDYVTFPIDIVENHEVKLEEFLLEQKKQKFLYEKQVLERNKKQEEQEDIKTISKLIAKYNDRLSWGNEMGQVVLKDK